MKRKYWIIVFLCLALLAFAMGCSNGTGGGGGTGEDAGGESGHIGDVDVQPQRVESSESAKPITLMVYMVGSDLEAATAAATNDLKEMEESGVNLSKVKLLVYTGGSPKWHNDSVEIPTDSNAVFELTKDGFVQVTDFAAASMGESDSLTRFLQYGYDNYKSETYGLILWDHGNGPVMGYGSDIQYGKDALTLPEIETALNDSPFGANEKLEFIGFDACLMSSVELACMVDDYADYLIASQEVEPGFGWNYQFLKQCGKVNTVTLIQDIVDEYISYSEDYFAQNEFFKSEVTLAVMDLSYAADLETSINNLFGAAADDVSGSFNELAVDRIETRAFGRATTGSEYDLVDLQALMSAMSDSYEKETGEVQEILDQMVIYSDSNTVESCGLSLYYPYYNKKYYESSWKESYSQLGLLPNYIDYLERYGQIWLGTDMKEYFSGKLVAEDGEESGVYTLQLTEEQAEHYADGGFYILRQMGEDVYSIVYYSQNVTNEDGLLTAKFDGRVIYYGDDCGFKAIPLTRALDEVDGQTRYAVFPTLTGSVADFMETDSMLGRMVLSVDPESGEVSVLDFSESTNEEIQTGKKQQINLDDWVRIQFYEITGRYLTRDEDGRILDYWEWPKSDWILANEIAIADGLNFTYEPLYDDGNEYFLMFDIMDVQGNWYSSELYPVTLEEKPKEKEVTPTDAGVLEESSALIYDREGVQLYLDLIKDSNVGHTAYCFRAVNSNDFPIRIYIDQVMVNETISCTDLTGYITAEANSTKCSFMAEISSVCLMEGVELPQQLDFTVRMNNEVNDKTLVNSEPFTLRISDKATSKVTFLEYMGVQAEEQKLLDAENGMQVTLVGAGYQLNYSNMSPESEFSELTCIFKIKNASDETQTVHVDSVDINGTLVEVNNFVGFSSEISLKPGQIYYYEWNMRGEKIRELGITEIQSLAFHLNAETLNIKLAQE